MTLYNLSSVNMPIIITTNISVVPELDFTSEKLGKEKEIQNKDKRTVNKEEMVQSTSVYASKQLNYSGFFCIIAK